MSYSQALKGALTRSGAIREIDSQAELEFGRKLTDNEKTIMFRRFPPQDLLNRIQKVTLKICQYFPILILVWLWIFEVHIISLQQT